MTRSEGAAVIPARPRGIFERPRGSGAWWIRYYDRAGTTRREKIGTQEEALRARAQRESEVRLGTWRPRTRGDRRDRTHAQLVREYEQQKQKAKPRGIYEKLKGSGIWWIRYRDGADKWHREKIGTRDDALLAVLDRKLRALRPGETSHAPLSFAELADKRMAQKKSSLSRASYRSDVLRLTKLTSAFGARQAASIHAAEIEQFLAGLRNEGMEPATANRYRSLLSNIFACGIKLGRIAANPVASVPRLAERGRSVRILTAEEEKLLHDALLARSEANAAEFDLAISTGLRRRELCALEWRDVDLGRSLITVKIGRHLRLVGINSNARRAIKTLHAESNGRPNVCEGKGSLTPRWFSVAAGIAGIKDFRWDDLRRTFVSRGGKPSLPDSAGDRRPHPGPDKTPPEQTKEFAVASEIERRLEGSPRTRKEVIAARLAVATEYGLEEETAKTYHLRFLKRHPESTDRG